MQVEDPRRALFLHGNKASQTIKDVLTDLHKLKAVRVQAFDFHAFQIIFLNVYIHVSSQYGIELMQNEALKFTRRNDDVQPFEGGGEARLEQHANRGNCSLFAMGSHSKKRPNNLILGRLYDFRLYDILEFGVTQYRAIREFPHAAAAQLGNKPSFIFVGDAFESDPKLQQVRSLLLDFFRGRQVEQINLKGLDRVIFVTHSPVDPSSERRVVLFRQYSVKYKKSGTRVPRVELQEMGPRLDLELRRSRAPPPDLEKEACKQAKVAPKKQKNVGADMLEGKVGRIYMPKQDIQNMSLMKMKGLKRERREGRAASSASKRAKKAGTADSGEEE